MKIFRWPIAFVLVTCLWLVAYKQGMQSGQRSLGYWEGWNDAVTYWQKNGHTNDLPFTAKKL